MRKLTPKIIISVLLLSTTVLLWNFYLHYLSESKKSTKAEIFIEKSEFTRLGLDGTEIMLLTSTNDHSTSRNFLVLDNKTGKTITTLSISSLGLWTPYYRIIKGKTHDWLVVTRLETWGTGMNHIYDDWYVLGWTGTLNLVLSYPSQSMLLGGSDGKNTYWRTEVINEDKLRDSTIDVKFIKKTCTVKDDQSDKECTETANTLNYVWDKDNEEFINKK